MSVAIDQDIIEILKQAPKVSAQEIIDKLEASASAAYISKRLKLLAGQRKIKIVQNSASLSSRFFAANGTQGEISPPDYELRASEFAQDLGMIEEPVTLTSHRKPKGVYLPMELFKSLCKKAGITNV